MRARVGINGFGRIGRNLFCAAKEAQADIDFVAGIKPFSALMGALKLADRVHVRAEARLPRA